MEYVAFFGKAFELGKDFVTTVTAIRQRLHLSSSQNVDVYVSYEEQIAMKNGSPDKSKLSYLGSHPWAQRKETK